MTLPGDRPWLIYDQRCGMCRSLVAWLDQQHLLTHATAVSIFDAAADLPLDLLDRTVHTALLYDPQSKTAIGGVDAFAGLLALHQRAPALRRLLGFRPVSFLAQRLYGFVSQHRRTLSPVPVEQRCAVCDPTETTGTFLTFAAVCFAIWILATGVWGASWGVAQGVDPWAGTGTAVLVTGFGWLLAMGQLPFLHRIGLDRPWPDVRELAKQLLLMLAASSLPLPVFGLITWLSSQMGAGHSPLVGGLNLFALTTSAATVLALWQQRRSSLGCPLLYPVLWLVAWVSGVVAAALVVNSFN